MLSRLECRCAEKVIWPMKLLDLVVWIFFLSYLEWTNNLIGFERSVKILEDPWKWQKGIIIFNVQQNRVVCRLKIFFFFPGQWDCWIWRFEFVFLVILSEIPVQCVMLFRDRVVAHYFCTLFYLKFRQILTWKNMICLMYAK